MAVNATKYSVVLSWVSTPRCCSARHASRICPAMWRRVHFARQRHHCWSLSRDHVRCRYCEVLKGCCWAWAAHLRAPHMSRARNMENKELRYLMRLTPRRPWLVMTVDETWPYRKAVSWLTALCEYTMSSLARCRYPGLCLSVYKLCLVLGLRLNGNVWWCPIIICLFKSVCPIPGSGTLK